MQEYNFDKIEIKSTFNKEAETLTFAMAGNALKEILNFKEEQTKQSLIKLGWISPEISKELLEALKLAKSLIISFPYRIQLEQIDAAIIKAEGKPCVNSAE